jgi:hypothetical protein
MPHGYADAPREGSWDIGFASLAPFSPTVGSLLTTPLLARKFWQKVIRQIHFKANALDYFGFHLCITCQN